MLARASSDDVDGSSRRPQERLECSPGAAQTPSTVTKLHRAAMELVQNVSAGYGTEAKEQMYYVMVTTDLVVNGKQEGKGMV
jgi:hypothetical protein